MLQEHKKEIQRWLNNSNEPTVWIRHKKEKDWRPIKFENCNWIEYFYYIINDEQAKLRKLQIDKLKTKFEIWDICLNKWVETKPTWSIDFKYRIKPIFKVKDKIHYKDSTKIYTIKEIKDDRYLLKESEDYILFSDQFQYKLVNEYKYPIFKIIEKGTNKECIVRFTSLKEGEVIFTMPDSCYTIGYKSTNWVAHNTENWQDILYDKEKKLYNKQPILCWDNCDLATRKLKFYDVKNKCTFSDNGKKNGYHYANYMPYPHPEDDFIIEMYRNLEN